MQAGGDGGVGGVSMPQLRGPTYWLKGGKKPHSCSVKANHLEEVGNLHPLKSEDRSGQGTHNTVVSLMEGWLSTKPLAPAESGSTEGV